MRVHQFAKPPCRGECFRGRDQSAGQQPMGCDREPAERNALAEQGGLHHHRVVGKTQRLGGPRSFGEKGRIFRRPIAGGIREPDDGVGLDPPVRAVGVAIGRAADRQHDFLHDQRAVPLRIVSVAKPHAEIDIVDRPAQRTGNKLEAEIDGWKLALQLVDAGHQPMGGERRGDRERDRLGALAAAVDLDQAAFDAAESIRYVAIEDLAFLRQDRAAIGPVEQTNAEIVLELTQHPAHRRLGDVQFGGSRSEAAIACRCVEDEQGVT